MNQKENHQLLVDLLKFAYSAELAAAYAYQGHWRSVRNPEERTKIQEIEQDEWHHRKLVGEMLESIGEHPSRGLEFKNFLIGKVVGFLCHLSGWFAPMYGAGKIERRNIKEYELAARYARNSGREEWVDCLLTMAEVEWEHEQYFRSQVEKHFFSRLVPIWPLPPPKPMIRASFLAETPKINA